MTAVTSAPPFFGLCAERNDNCRSSLNKLLRSRLSPDRNQPETQVRSASLPIGALAFSTRRNSRGTARIANPDCLSAKSRYGNIASLEESMLV